jgi:hypothetical protein
MSIILYSVYTVFNLALLVWALSVWRRTRRAGTLMIAAVTFGLTYDNLILTLGRVLEGGSLLYWLSIPRFVLHQIILPWLIWAVFDEVRVAGHPWAQGIVAKRVIAGLCLVVLLLGILTGIVPMDLQLVEMDGIQRYMNKGTVGPPIVSILSIGFAGVMGILLWKKNHWPWVFLTAAMVFILEGIPVEFVRRVAGSGAEVLFIIALLITEQRVETLQSPSERQHLNPRDREDTGE